MDSPSLDKEWATKYLLDPLTAPVPSEETGPGTHFNSSMNPRKQSPLSKSSSSSNSSTGMKTPSTTTYPTPPASASPTRSAFASTNPFRQPTSASPSVRTQEDQNKGKGHRRLSSLGERYAGDMSHRPLDQIRKENRAADRAPHLRKEHIPGADIIDSLDQSLLGGVYHHGGPYDATLLARNTNSKISPVAATRETNHEALRATPRENIRDALDKHVPLQGTATIPPGMRGYDGKIMNYKEGADLMRESDAPGGPYKRYDHVKYLPEDYKGKGEPSFSIERALKTDDSTNSHRRLLSVPNTYEMQPQRPGANRQRSVSGTDVRLTPANTSEIGRSNTTGRRVGEGLKRRFGSLRRSKKTDELTG